MSQILIVLSLELFNLIFLVEEAQSDEGIGSGQQSTQLTLKRSGYCRDASPHKELKKHVQQTWP